MSQLKRVVLIVSIFVWPQLKPTDEWNTVTQICGTLARDESTSHQEHSKKISKSPIRLYVRTDGSSCCSGLSPAAETKTDHSGAFHIEGIAPGKFWLAAPFRGSEYTLPITYQPNKSTPDTCTDQIFTIYKSGEFKLLRVVQVD